MNIDNTGHKFGLSTAPQSRTYSRWLSFALDAGMADGSGYQAMVTADHGMNDDRNIAFRAYRADEKGKIFRNGNAESLYTQPVDLFAA